MFKSHANQPHFIISQYFIIIHYLFIYFRFLTLFICPFLKHTFQRQLGQGVKIATVLLFCLKDIKHLTISIFQTNTLCIFFLTKGKKQHYKSLQLYLECLWSTSNFLGIICYHRSNHFLNESLSFQKRSDPWLVSHKKSQTFTAELLTYY